MRYVALCLVLAACGGDPCFESDYTTSGLCVHLKGYDLERDDVDFVVDIISYVANRHGLSGVNMARRLSEVGPVPLTMVPWASLGREEQYNSLIAGCTNYMTLAEWDNNRLSGYTVRIIDGQSEDQLLLTVAHELLHILSPEYIGTPSNINANHAEPYMFRLWVLHDRSYSPQDTVEGVTYTYIREYLGMED